ncbi:hypothetical protein ACS5PK_03995 [Roseateles sp. DB2]|uniref:hypothetical protein n=1 Tax=Roseateles sp. DB2 TaxID=3453717 RepID=UPI003EEF17C0
MTTQNSLAKAFDARKSFFAHRASAVFPLRIRTQSDLQIVFLNYWKLKAEIPEVAVNLRVYDTSGRLVGRQTLEKVELHNEVSIRDEVLAANGVEAPFDGMVEVEVVSLKNLAFPFPAILGVYQSAGYCSAVHAAGRVKNADELKRPLKSQETNWTCRFERNADGYAVVPFFHYFVGAAPLDQDETIEVSLRSPSGQVIAATSVPVGSMAPFSSRIFYADELFALDEVPEEGCFLSVALTARDIFPRLVVGNFHRSIEFLEVGHSFPISEFADYCPVPGADKPAGSSSSFLAAQTAEGLELDVKVFPTNCEGNARAALSSKKFNEARLTSLDQHFEFSSALGSRGLTFSLESDEEFRVLHLTGDSVPSRLNASYRYSVRNAPRRFATDIATGAKSIVYPAKWRHWGHGCVGGGYDTVILLRNNSHAPEETHSNAGEIRILGREIDRSVAVQVESESCTCLKLSELLDLDPEAGTPRMLSWLMGLSQPVGETFWIAYRPDGAIFGEHGF